MGYSSTLNYPERIALSDLNNMIIIFDLEAINVKTRYVIGDLWRKSSWN